MIELKPSFDGYKSRSSNLLVILTYCTRLVVENSLNSFISKGY